MPDAAGFPTVGDVADKLKTAAPAGITRELLSDLPAILAAVIAEFQGPVGLDGEGGTGRSFTPIVTTRAYDGNGYPELLIDDLDPASGYLVTLYGTPLTDVQVKTGRDGLGSNVLYRPQLVGGVFLTGVYAPPVFPLGLQNILVTATFGMPVTPDVYEAIRCEVCYRALVQAEVGIDGFGEVIKIGAFTFDSSVGSSQFQETSSLAVFHETYRRCLLRYRTRESWKWKRTARRMS
jgi:hypothetical protein